jgi:hypothetical protein
VPVHAIDFIRYMCYDLIKLNCCFLEVIFVLFESEDNF